MYCIFHWGPWVVQRWDLEETRQPRGQLRVWITRDPNKQEEYAAEGKWPNCFVFVSAGPLWADVFLWVVTYCARLVLYGWAAVGKAVWQREVLFLRHFNIICREISKEGGDLNSNSPTVPVHFPFASSFLLGCSPPLPRPHPLFPLRPFQLFIGVVWTVYLRQYNRGRNSSRNGVFSSSAFVGREGRVSNAPVK